MIKILMVCLGNICRSPLAEGILQSKLSTELFFVDSAGTGDWHIGSPPDKRSIAVAKKYNIDLTTQRARQFSVSDFHTFDRIYAMDQSNYNNIIKLAPDAETKNKVKLILKEITPDQNLDIPDPYFGGDNGFEHVYKLLDEVCNIIAEDLKAGK